MTLAELTASTGGTQLLEYWWCWPVLGGCDGYWLTKEAAQQDPAHHCKMTPWRVQIYQSTKIQLRKDPR